MSLFMPLLLYVLVSHVSRTFTASVSAFYLVARPIVILWSLESLVKKTAVPEYRRKLFHCNIAYLAVKGAEHRVLHR